MYDGQRKTRVRAEWQGKKWNGGHAEMPEFTQDVHAGAGLVFLCVVASRLSDTDFSCLSSEPTLTLSTTRAG